MEFLGYTVPVVQILILFGILIVLPSLFGMVTGIYHRFYVVVPPEQVHIVVTKNGKKVYQNKDDYSSTYWFFSWWMTRNVLPLEQIPIAVSKSVLSLHDEKRIPFRCDVVAWLVIKDPIVAAERIGNLMDEQDLRALDKQKMIEKVSYRLSRDIDPMIRAVTRTASFKTSLLDIMKDRAKFAKQVETDLDISLQEWGLLLTALEVLHIEDVETETVGGEKIRGVIKNWELQETKITDTQTRILIAEKEKEARESEALNKKLAEIAVAENEEHYRRRQIEKEQNIEIANQEMNMAIQQKTKEANLKKIEADRELEVGRAAYQADAKVKTAIGDKQSAIEQATGDRQAAVLKAEGESQATLMTGKASAEIVQVQGVARGAAIRAERTANADGELAMLNAKAEGNKAYLLGEADGLDKKADAQQKLQDNAVFIQLIEAAKQIEIAKYQYLAEGIKGANTQIIAGGMAELFGNKITPEEGAGLGATLGGLINALPPEIKSKIPDVLSSLDKKDE